MSPLPTESRRNLLDAALRVIRAQGYTATTVDDLCAAAGLSKGSFFHHFKGKEDLALAAIEHWNTTTGALFAEAPYHRFADPLERLFAYVDFRAQLLQGDLPDFTCLLGTLVQETYLTHPAIRQACERGIQGHADTIALIAAQAKAHHAPDAHWTPEGLALYTQAVLQGAFVLAKAKGGPAVAAQCVALLKDHLERLLGASGRRPTKPTKPAAPKRAAPKRASPKPAATIPATSGDAPRQRTVRRAVR